MRSFPTHMSIYSVCVVRDVHALGGHVLGRAIDQQSEGVVTASESLPVGVNDERLGLSAGGGGVFIRI